MAEELGKSWGEVRCIFNEKDSAAFQRLSTFVPQAAERFPLVEMCVFHGAFEKNAARIRDRASNSFRLLFVDPTGFTGFPPETLKLFEGRSSEVIVNFMESFVRRFPTQPRVEQEKWLAGLVGPIRASELAGQVIDIDVLRSVYLQMVKETLGYRYSACSPIHNPDRDEVQFQLIFGTNHPDGMEEMRTAEFSALSAHDRDRFVRRGIEPAYQDLFGPQTREGPYLTERLEHQRQLPEAVLSEVNRYEGCEFDVMRARIQESLFVRDMEVARAVVELASAGRLQPTWKDRGANMQRPKSGDLMLLT